jgi:hypothetical protein
MGNDSLSARLTNPNLFVELRTDSGFKTDLKLSILQQVTNLEHALEKLAKEQKNAPDNLMINIRDEFAMHALNSVLSLYLTNNLSIPELKQVVAVTAELSYIMADQMIEARKVNNGQ